MGESALSGQSEVRWGLEKGEVLPCPDPVRPCPNLLVMEPMAGAVMGLRPLGADRRRLRSVNLSQAGRQNVLGAPLPEAASVITSASSWDR